MSNTIVEAPSPAHLPEGSQYELQDIGKGTPKEADSHSKAESSADHSTSSHEGPAALVKESWRNPTINIFRMAAIFLAFFNLGLHDAAYGPIIPSLEEYYGLNYTTVSLIFLATFPGYLVAALTTDRLHLKFGARGVAGIASAARIAAYVALSCHPPWAVIVVLLAFCGWGNGLLDAAWNAWVGALDKPNVLLGCIHSVYGLGAALAPIIASTMIDRNGLQFYHFYYIPLALAGVELITGVSSFWAEDGASFQRKNADEAAAGGGRTRAALKSRVTWTIAVFLLIYVGVEVSLSGWVVTFMVRHRNAEPFPSAMTATGFWLGITFGRLALGFVTERLGERWTTIAYLAIGMGLQLLFWLVPKFIVSAVAVALLGFFLGPMFPASMAVVSKMLPRHIRVGAISFTAALGMGGAAVIPFAVGAIANVAGVQALQPIILALLVVLLLIWFCLPWKRGGEHLD